MPVMATKWRRHDKKWFTFIAGIRCFQRTACLLVDAAGPVDLHIGFRADQFACNAVYDVKETVLGRLHEDLA